MYYLVERYYFDSHPPIVGLREALAITAKAVARYSTHYRAELLTPKRGTPLPTIRAGALPSPEEEKDHLVEALITWLYTYSVGETFRLVLLRGEEEVFHFPEVHVDWYLHITPAEFKGLRDIWRAHGLPEDLFFPEDNLRCVPWPGHRWRDRLWRLLGVRKCFTPREWMTKSASE